jgi:hypothetical protein
LVKKKEVRESGREGRVRERRKHMVSGRPVAVHGRTGRPGDREVMGQDPAKRDKMRGEDNQKKIPKISHQKQVINIRKSQQKSSKSRCVDQRSFTGGQAKVKITANGWEAYPAHQVIKYGVKTERSGCLLLFFIKNTNNSQRNRVKTVKKWNSHRILKQSS